MNRFDEDPVALMVADLYHAAGLSRRLGERIAKSEGQTQARWQLLSVVRDEPRTVPQAARRLGTSRQGVQRVADQLLAEGLLRSQDNPDHRTSPLVSITETGQQILQRMSALAWTEHEAQLQSMSLEEIDRLRAGLQRLAGVLEQRTEASRP